jgi:transposase
LTHRFNWKKASMAAALCYGVRGGGAQLCFHVTAGTYDTATLIEVLGELRRFLGGEKATLLWDGLPAHRSRAMRAFMNTQRHWPVVERLPAYAPELNPVEALWSSLKAIELANLTSPTLAEVIAQAHQGIERVRRTPISPIRSYGTPAYRSHDPSTQHPSPLNSRRGSDVLSGCLRQRRGRRRRGGGTAAALPYSNTGAMSTTTSWQGREHCIRVRQVPPVGQRRRTTPGAGPRWQPRTSLPQSRSPPPRSRRMTAQPGRPVRAMVTRLSAMRGHERTREYGLGLLNLLDYLT